MAFLLYPCGPLLKPNFSLWALTAKSQNWHLLKANRLGPPKRRAAPPSCCQREGKEPNPMPDGVISVAMEGIFR
jgi:hypothetical protein